MANTSDTRANTGVSEGKYTIGYARVSTEEQAQSGFSITGQEEKIRDYCKLKDIINLKMIKDEGGSGKNLNREGLKKILTLIENKEVKGLIVYKIDRLTRSVKDLGYLIELMEKNNIEFISITESIDTTTAGGKLMLNVIGSVAQWEREIISERTKFALDVKRKIRERTGGIPYGYRAIKTDKVNKKGIHIERLEPIPAEQKIVERIKKLSKEGLSSSRIAQTLNKEGIKTKNDTKWYHSTINQILRRNADDNITQKKNK